MPELALYRNPEIQYAPRINLQVADKSLTTMEQNHLKTIELQGELEAAVNAMDLDESENEYKAGLINEIKQSVNNSTIDGYSGYALSDIVRKYGDINGNQLLMGKVKANAAHKKYIADTQARTDITQDTKDMFIEQNPYNLNKTDDNGNVLEPGSYDWMPKTTAVRDVPLTEIFDAAIKIASPEMSQWDTVIYQNSDGTTSKTAGPNTIGYIDSSGKTTRLSKEKLLDAVNAVINSNQEYRASLNQAFEVQKWKLKNGRIPKETYESGVVPGIDKAGNPTSLDEYIKASVDPFLNAKMYSYTESNKKYNPFTANQLRALSGATGNGSGASNLLGYASISGRNVGGNNIAITDDQFLTDNLVGTIRLAGDIRNKLTDSPENGGFGISNSDLGLSADSIGIPADYSIIQNAVLKSKGVSSINDLDDDTKDFLNRTKADYLLYAATIDDYNNAISGNDAGAAWRFLTPLVSTGQDISQFANSTNEYVKQVAQARASAIKSAFNNGNGKTADWIKMSYDNENDLNEALASLGGIQSALDSGLTISGNDIILDYKNRNQIENFAQLVAPGKKGHFYREGFGRVDRGGIISFLSNRSDNAPTFQTKGQLYNSFINACKVLDSLPSADTYNKVANREQFTVTPSVVPGATIDSYSLHMMLEDPNLDKDTRAAYNKALTEIEANTYTLLQGKGLSNIGIWRYNEKTNEYDNVDDLAFEGNTPNYSKALNEKVRIQRVLRQTPKNNIEFDLFFIPAVGWRPGYRIYSGQPEDYEDSNGNTKQTTRKLLENIVLNVPKGIGDSGLDYLNNDSYTQGSTDVTSAMLRGNAVTIGKDYSGNYGAKYNKDKNGWELTLNGNVINQDNDSVLSTEQVTNFRQAYRAAVDDIPAIRKNYEELFKANPNEDISKIRTAVYLQGLCKNHPQVKWNLVDPSILEYILFEY